MSAAVDTSAVRSAVTAVPGVVRVNGRGPNGVSADDAEVEVHVVARYGEVLPELAERVDRAVGPLTGGRSLRLVVDDVATDEETAAEAAGPSDDEPTGGSTAGPTDGAPPVATVG